MMRQVAASLAIVHLKLDLELGCFCERQSRQFLDGLYKIRQHWIFICSSLQLTRQLRKKIL